MDDQVARLKSKERNNANDRHFINLTNGIEALSVLPLSKEQINFVRLQSTHLERGDYHRFLQEIDYNLLMHLALGNTCYLYDYGCRRNDEQEPLYGHSRIHWMGVPFMRFILNRVWCERLTDTKELPEYKAGKIIPDAERQKTLVPYNWRAEVMIPEFKKQLLNMDKSLLGNLKYFRKYITPEIKEFGVQLVGVGKYSGKDGEYEYYKEAVLSWQNCR
jgi:hypothetical protein